MLASTFRLDVLVILVFGTTFLVGVLLRLQENSKGIPSDLVIDIVF